MPIAIDIGNTSIKIGFFKDLRPYQVQICHTEKELWPLLPTSPSADIIFSSVSSSSSSLHKTLEKIGALRLYAQLPGLPIRIAYKTPESLGTDRLAAAAGAACLYPQKDCLIVDVGTCVSYTFIDAHSNLQGGTITPGPQMRLKALSTYTSNLPAATLSPNPELVGHSTKASLRSGAWHGTKAEIEGLIKAYTQKYKKISILLCGGAAQALDIQTKVPTFVEEGLVLIGLQHILQCHKAYHKPPPAKM